MKPSTCWCSEMKVNSRFRVKWFQQVRSWMTCQSFIDMNKMKRLFLRSIIQWHVQRYSCGWGTTLNTLNTPPQLRQCRYSNESFWAALSFRAIFFCVVLLLGQNAHFFQLKCWGTLEMGKYHWHLSFVYTMSRSCVGLGTLCFLAPTFNLF